MTTANQTPHDDDMPDELDFSKGVRGKFYKPNAVFKLRVYLETEVQAYLSTIASRKGVDLSDLVSELLKKDIELIEAGS